MKYRVSNRQVFFTFALTIVLSLGIPNLILRELSQDFWQPLLLALLIEVCIAWLLYKMGLKYPGLTMFEYNEKILGKYLGKIGTFVFSAFFIVVVMVLVQITVEFYISMIMPDTPGYVFIFFILLVSTYAVCSGIEVIMSMSEVISLFVISSYLFIIFFNVKLFNIDNMEPMFQHSPLEIVRGAVLPTSWLGVCLVMGVLMAYHNNPKDMFKMKMGGVLTGVIVLTAVIFTIIAVLGVEVGSRQVYSIMILAQMVSVGDFIERMEAFQVVSWMAGSFFSIALFHYAGAEGLRQLFAKKLRNGSSHVIAIFIFFVSVFLLPTIQDKTYFVIEIFTKYALWVEVGGVVSLFGVFMVKERFKKSLKKRK
ncbi:MAG: GerAB/ArcD/ProY family transporter [Desulfitobacterium sp.]